MKTINHSTGPESGCFAAANNISRMCVRVHQSKATARGGTYCELLFSAASAPNSKRPAFFSSRQLGQLAVEFAFFSPSSLALNFLISAPRECVDSFAVVP